MNAINNISFELQTIVIIMTSIATTIVVSIINNKYRFYDNDYGCSICDSTYSFDNSHVNVFRDDNYVTFSSNNRCALCV